MNQMLKIWWFLEFILKGIFICLKSTDKKRYAYFLPELPHFIFESAWVKGKRDKFPFYKNSKRLQNLIWIQVMVIFWKD